jgi:response regulator RpfG family c-di-GMP phosphodiesterase
MSIFDPGDGNFIVIDGQIVERDSLRIAEKIKEFDPNLEVFCLDPELADVNDAPFVIVEYVNGVFKRVMEAWTLDDQVLHRLHFAHSTTVEELTQKYEDLKKVQYDRKMSRYKEIKEAKKDLVKHIVADKHSNYSFKDEETGEKVTVFDDRPAKRGSFPLSKGSHDTRSSVS